ncbi:hypothetical protein Tco_0264760 [Tanacetum coccineum]
MGLIIHHERLVCGKFFCSFLSRISISNFGAAKSTGAISGLSILLDAKSSQKPSGRIHYTFGQDIEYGRNFSTAYTTTTQELGYSHLWSILSKWERQRRERVPKTEKSSHEGFSMVFFLNLIVKKDSTIPPLERDGALHKPTGHAYTVANVPLRAAGGLEWGVGCWGVWGGLGGGVVGCGSGGFGVVCRCLGECGTGWWVGGVRVGRGVTGVWWWGVGDDGGWRGVWCGDGCVVGGVEVVGCGGVLKLVVRVVVRSRWEGWVVNLCLSEFWMRSGWCGELVVIVSHHLWVSNGVAWERTEPEVVKQYCITITILAEQSDQKSELLDTHGGGDEGLEIGRWRLKSRGLINRRRTTGRSNLVRQPSEVGNGIPLVVVQLRGL